VVTDVDLSILPPTYSRRSPYLLVPLLEEPRTGNDTYRNRGALQESNLVPLREELRAWVSVVALCADACLVLDADGRVVALSPATATLVGTEPADAVGRMLVGDVLALVDFSSAAEPLRDVGAIPPVSAATAGVPCHGLMRLRRPDGPTVTLDTISTPLHGAEGQRLGSLSFFARVGSD
jgi:PAS domain-containing protein